MHSPEAKNYMSALSAFCTPDDNLYDVLQKMFEFQLPKIVVCNRQMNITGAVSKKDIRNFLAGKNKERQTGMQKDEFNIEILQEHTAAEVLNPETTVMTAYPATSIVKALECMEALGVNCMPVVKSPWNKVLQGFIDINHVNTALNLSPGF